jgi:GT2 family glycosyltransferase
MSLPSVDLVIPTRNRVQPLKNCITRLVPYISAHPECQIIVSDDGDASKTAETFLAELSIVRVVQGPRRGPAANRNCGAAHSSGDLIVFLDDDCEPDPNLIAAYQTAAINHPDVSVFEGRISATGAVSSFADTAPTNETGGYLWSCNFAIRRALFEVTGGFDERFPFPAVEDVDFHLRVKKLSPVLFLPAARVWHPVERRLGWKIVKHHTLSVLLFLHIHGPEATNKTPSFFLRMAVKSLLLTSVRHLRAGTTKHPFYLLHRVWVSLHLSVILMFWSFHATLARWLYPPCCSGCKSIHAVLASSDCCPWFGLPQKPN